MRLLKTNFFRFLLILTGAFVTVYIIFHLVFQCYSGVHQKTTTEDIAILNDVDSAKKEILVTYLDNKYGLISTAEREKQVKLANRVGKSNYIKMISSTGVLTKSIFLLDGDWVILELVFWSWFGTLCSFLYYYSENKKKNALDEREFTAYIAKIFYAPFVTIVIFYVPNLFSSANSFFSSGGHWILVFAFILGFFSGRAIELLDKIKNLIFPYNNINTTVTENNQVNTDTDQKVVDHAVPAEILIEAIDKKGEEWQYLYGPLESISTGYKNINNSKTQVACIHFDVRTKPVLQDVDRAKVIPAVIGYLALNGITYQIPTDVNEVGITTPDAYDLNQPMSLGKELNPKMLSLSCSRIGSMAAGTIGLKVAKIGDPDTQYLLSCYHVLCSPEKEQGKIRVKSANDLVQDGTIVSPGLIDGNNDSAGGTVSLARVTEGILLENMDIAIARLDKSLTGVVYRTSFVPSAEHLLPINSVHEKSGYPLKLVGRTSGKQKGEITSAYCSVNINYVGISAPVTFNGVIKATKMSMEGDSGAAIYDDAKNLIGILFASNDNYSYILPIVKVLSKLNLQIA